jgi:DNA-binding transcriptional ArsR family regulator
MRSAQRLYPTIKLKQSYKQELELLSLLSDPTRFKILKLLFETNEDLCVSEISVNVGISQSATSHQLIKLNSLDIVKPVRKGRKICYELEKNDEVRKIRRIMKTVDKL